MLRKKCPRCDGNTYREDGPDNDIVCLQCGWRQYPSFTIANTGRRSEPVADSGKHR